MFNAFLSNYLNYETNVLQLDVRIQRKKIVSMELELELFVSFSKRFEQNF